MKKVFPFALSLTTLIEAKSRQISARLPASQRFVSVSGNIALKKLHYVIQDVMGWENCHLHLFKIRNEEFAIDGYEFEEFDRLVHEAADFRVRGVMKKVGQTMRYTYDLGDTWVHEITVVGTHPPIEGVRYPTCVAGQRACPPEDAGGPRGYSLYLDILADPEHEQHEELTAWRGPNFDSEKFDVEEVNRRLSKLR